MTRKKITPYDLIEATAGNLNYLAEELDTFKKNFKKGIVNIKEITQFRRDALFYETNLKLALDDLKDQRLQYDKLYKRQPKDNELNRDLD